MGGRRSTTFLKRVSTNERSDSLGSDLSALVTFRLGISPLSTKSPPPPLPPMLLAILAVETTPRLILLSPLSTPERELGSGKRIWEGRVDFSFSPLTPPPPPAAPAGGSSGRSGNAAATTAALITGAGAAAAATSFYFSPNISQACVSGLWRGTLSCWLLLRIEMRRSCLS